MVRKFMLALVLSCTMSSPRAEPAPDNQRLTEIFQADQGARRSMPIDWAKVAPMDKAHKEEVLALLRAGEVRTSGDLYRAAMIMQHGDTTDDYQIAFSLSRLSATLDPLNKKAKWLAAASWDRILQSKGVPQWYGTQYQSPAPGAPMELYRVDESVISDAERAAMNVPSLQEAKDMLKQINE